MCVCVCVCVCVLMYEYCEHSKLLIKTSRVSGLLLQICRITHEYSLLFLIFYKSDYLGFRLFWGGYAMYISTS